MQLKMAWECSIAMRGLLAHQSEHVQSHSVQATARLWKSGNSNTDCMFQEILA